MKKTLLFVINGFHSGGICKAFLPFVQRIDFSKYDVYIHPTADYKIWSSILPEAVKIISSNDINKKHTSFITLFSRAFHYVCIHLTKKNVVKDFHAVSTWGLSKQFYDCVICYNAQDMAAVALASRYRAQKRVLWFHGAASDLDKSFINIAKKLIKYFSSAITVSNSLSNDILSVYPKLKDRISVIHNTVNTEEINEMAEKKTLSLKKTSIVTVGRICCEKGQFLIPETVKKLLDDDYIIYWYIIGDGNMKDEILNTINKCGISEHVILLGNQENPFPYMKDCDIYVQTSLSEGWGLSVQEARILCKPIIVTPLPVMYEQIQHGKNGLIASDTTPDALVESIKMIMDYPELSKIFIDTLKNEQHGNADELQKLYDLIEGEL